MTELEAQAREAFATTKDGNLKIAKRLGVDRETVAQWRRPSRAPTPAPAREDGQPPTRPRKQRGQWRARLEMMDWQLDKMVQVEDAIEKILKSEKFNAAGLAALLARAASFRAEYERAKSAQPDDLEGATPAEIRSILELQLTDWPDDHLEMAFRVYAERHGGTLLFVGEGGHRSEFDADTGWESTGTGE